MIECLSERELAATAQRMAFLYNQDEAIGREREALGLR
jgi:hypothetical protein